MIKKTLMVLGTIVPIVISCIALYKAEVSSNEIQEIKFLEKKSELISVLNNQIQTIEAIVSAHYSTFKYIDLGRCKATDVKNVEVQLDGLSVQKEHLQSRLDVIQKYTLETNNVADIISELNVININSVKVSKMFSLQSNLTRC